MALLIHILIALASVAVAAAALAAPSHAKLRVSYGLIAATVTSGTYLVVVSGASLLHACISGLLFVTAASALTALGHRKLARARA